MNTVVATTVTPPPQGSAAGAEAAPVSAPPVATTTAAPAPASVVVVKETIGKDGQPVREWIDTLLMAAVIAKDKQQQQPSGEGTDPAAEASSTAQAAVPTEAPVVEPRLADASAMGENSPMNGSDTENRAVANTITTAAASHDSTKTSATKEDQENRGDTTPKGDSNDSAISTQNEGARQNEEVDEQLVEEAQHGDDSDAKRYRRRRCEVPGCTKFARFNNACSGHGGRRLCSHTGCTRVAQFGHKCSAHGGIKYCSVEGCSRAVQSRGCCKTHGGGVRCQTPGCEKGAISKGHCRAHGGGSRCAESGCQKWAQRHGFCVRHSKTESGGADEDAEA